MSAVDPLAEMMSKFQVHSSAIQGLQVTVEHVAKTTDRIYAQYEKHGDLAHELARLRDVVDRTQLDAKKGDEALLVAIKELSSSIREDRTNSVLTGNQVTKFAGGLLAVKWAMGILATVSLVLGGAAFTMFSTAWDSKLASNTTADVERRVRISALEGQVIELRLGQGQRDRELERRNNRAPPTEERP